MSYNYRNKNNKRSSDDFDAPCDSKRCKYEPDRATEEQPKPESANDRLKRLRNALSDPNNDQREHIGWKPSAITTPLQINKGRKLQLLAQRQYINPLPKVSQSQREESPPEKLQSIKNYVPISENATRKPLNQRLHSSIGDRLKVNKASGPQSLKLIRRQINVASNFAPNVNNNVAKSKDCQPQLDNTTSGSDCPQNSSTIFSVENATGIKNALQLPLQNSTYRKSDTFTPCNSVDPNISRTTKYSIKDDSLKFPKASDVSKNTNDNSIFGKSSDASFERFKGSQQSSLCDLDEDSNLFGKFTLTREHFYESPNQSSRNSSESDNIESPSNFPDETYFKSAKKSSNSKITKVTEDLIPPFNSPSYSVNANANIFNYSNLRGVSNGYEPGNITPRKDTNIFSPAAPVILEPRKISIQDRLKKTGQILNNSVIVSTISKSSPTINSVPDILQPTRNSDEIEPEPMEWTDVDVTEVVQNVEQMRKVLKFPPGTQTNLQQMLNANNTFAEMYQNFREDCNETDYYIVIDTNVFLSKLGIIKEILSMNLKDDKKLYIYIPWMVIQELDFFKDSKCAANKLQANARKAIMLLNECLGVKGSHVKAQLVSDALEAKCISNNPDDIILACCLQAKERNHYVMLLSNDTNLRNKAIINKVSAYSTSDILEKLKCKIDKSGLQIDVEQIELRTSILLSVVVDGCLREAYGDIIDQMAVKKPPYTVFYALELMRKYWVAVFSSILQKQCLTTIDKLYDLMRQQNYTGLPETDDKSKFVDLTLTLCVFLKTSFPQHTDNINKLTKFIQSSTGR